MLILPLTNIVRLIWLVGFFYDISTIVGYQKPNQFSYTETVLFQSIQFSVSTRFSSIRTIDRTLSDFNTLGQNGPGRDGTKGVLRIPQSSSISGTSPADYVALYSGQSFGGSLIPLQRCSQCILQPQPSGPKINMILKKKLNHMYS